MNSPLKILLSIFVLTLITSCNKNEIVEFNLVKGNVDYHTLTSLSFTGDIDNNAYSELILVEKDTTGEQFNYRMQVIEWESNTHLHSELIDTDLLDVKAYDLDNNGQKEICYTYLKGDSLFLKIFNPFSNKIFLNKNIQEVKSRKELHTWDGSCSIENFADLNIDGYPEIILNLSGHYDKTPRGILVYDIINKQELWHYWTGPLIYNIQVEDLNLDGKPELFFDNSSPGNGVFTDETDDFHNYFVVLNNEGELLFNIETGTENSHTFFTLVDPGDNQSQSIISFTRTGNFKHYKNFGSKIWKWNKNLIFYKVAENYNIHFISKPVYSLINGSPSFIIINLENQLCVVDTSLRILITLPYNFKFSGYMGSYDLNFDGRDEFLFNAGPDGLILLDYNLNLIGKLPKLNRIFEIQQGRRKHVRYAGLNKEGRLFDFTIQKPSFIQKIISNPLPVAVIVLIPINLFLLFLLFFRRGNWKWYRTQLQYFDEALSGLILIDNKEKIVACNKRSRMMLSKSEMEIENKNYKEVFSGNYSEIGDWISACKVTRTNNEKLFRLRENGDEFILKLYIQFIVSLHKKPEGAVIIINDVMPAIQSHKTAVWLEIAQKLAHQIKNPLSTVRLTLQRIQMEFEDKPELKSSLGKIIQEGLSDAGTIQKVTDDFMKFSRLESAFFKKVQLKEIILNLVEKYLLKLDEDIVIKTEIDDIIPPVYADETQMSTAIMNLIDNSVHSVNTKGEITIRVKYSELIKPDLKNLIEKYVIIEISDNGEGMDDQTQKKVFEPFYTTRPGGSGLGLIIAKRIIEDHNGTLNIWSHKGVGTRVTINLPLRDA
jgi:PAS domain S-box-containing protein